METSAAGSYHGGGIVRDFCGDAYLVHSGGESNSSQSWQRKQQAPLCWEQRWGHLELGKNADSGEGDYGGGSAVGLDVV